jgi:hypothetical protein
MRTRILYKETLLYRGASLVHIDKAKDALYWCKRHGMTFVETIAADDTGDKFDIYTNQERGLACAIPVEA